MAAKKKAAKRSTAKRSTAKRSTAKRSVKKSAKKSSAKKSAKRSTRSATNYSIPAVPISGSSRSSISSMPKSSGSTSYTTRPASKSSGSSNGIVVAVAVGILILGILVVSRNSSSSDSTTVTPTPAASESAAPTEQPSAAPLAAHEPPVGIVSLYNATGATVNWKTPAASEGITGYNVELSANGNGSWVLVATVPATQFKQQITKTDDAGWAQVKVSTVYSDGEVVAGKVHGLPGSWS